MNLSNYTVVGEVPEYPAGDYYEGYPLVSHKWVHKKFITDPDPRRINDSADGRYTLTLKGAGEVELRKGDKVVVLRPGAGWTKEWPTEPGFYWFFGWNSRFIKKDRPPKLGIVQVWEGLVYVLNGQFMYHGEGAEGVFKQFDAPDLTTARSMLGL